MSKKLVLLKISQLQNTNVCFGGRKNTPNVEKALGNACSAYLGKLCATTRLSSYRAGVHKPYAPQTWQHVNFRLITMWKYKVSIFSEFGHIIITHIWAQKYKGLAICEASEW